MRARCGRCGSGCWSSRVAAAWCVHASSCGSSAVPPQSTAPVLRKLCICRPALSSHRRLHHSPPKPSACSRPFAEPLNSKAASPRRRRLRHQHPLPALHETHCSHAPHIAPTMRRHPRPRMLLLLVEQALPATAVAREPQAAHCSAWCCRRRCCTACSPCLWPSETRAFCRRRRQGRESSSGERRRGEKGRGCGDAQQQVLMASGWWRVQLSELYNIDGACAPSTTCPPLRLALERCCLRDDGGGGGVVGLLWRAHMLLQYL